MPAYLAARGFLPQEPPLAKAPSEPRLRRLLLVPYFFCPFRLDGQLHALPTHPLSAPSLVELSWQWRRGYGRPSFFRGRLTVQSVPLSGAIAGGYLDLIPKLAGGGMPKAFDSVSRRFELNTCSHPGKDHFAASSPTGVHKSGRMIRAHLLASLSGHWKVGWTCDSAHIHVVQHPYSLGLSPLGSNWARGVSRPSRSRSLDACGHFEMVLNAFRLLPCCAGNHDRAIIFVFLFPFLPVGEQTIEAMSAYAMFWHQSRMSIYLGSDDPMGSDPRIQRLSQHDAMYINGFY
uniref:Uncharacterized protein n=1 Tax=Coccidioides posadasii RMSCC 3488 TaxID=454284 RepID=A0A0J6ICY9_COCPO|nr:hypothetical protein CPAG_05892 [Coccidioides posadasii RMSCC 3488]